MQAKALQSTADLVMFDLEDSVALAEKEAARQQVITTLKGLPEHHPRLAMRCNGLETAWFYRDVIEILEAAVDRVSVLVIPKVENAGDVACFSRLLDGIERHTKAQQPLGLRNFVFYASPREPQLLKCLSQQFQRCLSRDTFLSVQCYLWHLQRGVGIYRSTAVRGT